MKIGPIDLQKKVFIVAEAGNNHEGRMDVAERLVDEAARSGADAIKFQTIVAEKLVSALEKERVAQLKKFELSQAQFASLAKRAAERGILFMSTPFDLESVGFLDALVPAFKIASGDNDFFPLIHRVAETGKPLLFSTGMTDLDAVKRTKKFIEDVWRDKKIKQEMAILHCVSSYPVAPEEASLSAIQEIAALGATAGYSDHTIGLDAAVLAVGCGARVIEKHFTLDKKFSSFRDHTLSADPADMAELVRRIRSAERLLGEGPKRVMPSEKENSVKARRSIVAGRDLSEGSVLTPADLTWTRPGTGLAPGRESEVLGKTLVRGLRRGENITLKDVR